MVQESETTVRRISSVTDFIEALNSAEIVPTPWFRGQRDSSWSLKPGVRRFRSFSENEQNIIKRFRQEASYLHAYASMTEWDWICMAQHYGIPTRLLDWSTNPLIALYFATDHKSYDEKSNTKLEATDGAVFRLDPQNLNELNFGPDSHVMLLGTDPQLDEYLPSIQVNQRREPIAVIATRPFARINAQFGTFTIFHPNGGQDLLEQQSAALERWVVPAEHKLSIRMNLKALGIDRASVFQDLDSRASRVMEDYE